jgi:hypothetical protein
VPDGNKTIRRNGVQYGMTALQMFGIDPLGSVMLALAVLFVIVVFGTFLGVLGALQTFFGESSWQGVSTVEE